MTEQKKPIQFSKKVVIGVCNAVTIISVLGIILDFTTGCASEATNIVKMYIQYAMVVFAAYSGNSVAEKWLLNNKTKAEEE